MTVPDVRIAFAIWVSYNRVPTMARHVGVRLGHLRHPVPLALRRPYRQPAFLSLRSPFLLHRPSRSLLRLCR
jgi:hypothetical protein